MSAKMNAAAEITRFLSVLDKKTFEGVRAVAVELGRIGSIEQAAGEAEARLARARNEIQQAEANLVEVSKKAAGLNMDAGKVLREAEESALVITQRAHQQAEKVLADARAERAARVTDLEAKVAQLKQEIKDQVALKMAYEQSVAVAKSELNDVQSQMAAIKSRLG